ncbi:MAG: type pilus assembly protein PilA, partial [Caldanaerobacter sp.]|nr:type pilus assembly protein PilA [Caldanaerobacter sp.]MDI3529659.1 type pilus assembly protein PilA [Thermoanaerobacter sp.]
PNYIDKVPKTQDGKDFKYDPSTGKVTLP